MILCKISELTVSLPLIDDTEIFCQSYYQHDDSEPEICIDASKYDISHWPGLDEKDLVYMESGLQFYWQLLNFNGMMLHASCFVTGGEAFLFSAPCGYGKSTHTKLFKRFIDPEGLIINDDKPALRKMDGEWIAFGTPWSGSDHINVNTSAPVKAICFLDAERDRNEIRRLSPQEAVSCIFEQTTNHLRPDHMVKLLDMIGDIVENIPVYKMISLADENAAKMAFEAMKNGKINEKD